MGVIPGLTVIKYRSIYLFIHVSLIDALLACGGVCDGQDFQFEPYHKLDPRMTLDSILLRDASDTELARRPEER